MSDSFMKLFRLTRACCAEVTLAGPLVASPAAAQFGTVASGPGSTCDMSGEWAARSREDWEDRALMGTNLGDYTGIPLNDAGRQFARTYSASLLSLKTQQALPHPPQYFMRGPGP